MSKKSFIKGTFILTLAGVITRIIGFFYRIYLTRAIGSDGIGLYQLVLPAAAVCYAAGISGLEIAITRFIAFYYSRKMYSKAKKYAIFCSLISFTLCIICTFLLNAGAGFIANNIFHNESCSNLIKILSYSIPFSCIHCMISGYNLGMEKTVIPASSQLFEQLIRVFSVYIIINIFKEGGTPPDASVGILGIVTGEIGVSIFCISSILLGKKKSHSIGISKIVKEQICIKEIITTALPVSLNRLSFHGIQSIETALIPLMLITYGYTQKEALSTFGIISGMVIPIILFPATLTHSVSAMLLPSSSKMQNNLTKLKKAASIALLYSVLFGLTCSVLFVLIGGKLGSILFHEPLVKQYVCILGWLCPFINITSTFKSMLHAIGQTGLVFANNMLSELLCLVCIVFLIPRFGIMAYLTGLLLSQMLGAILLVISFKITIVRQNKPV